MSGDGPGRYLALLLDEESDAGESFHPQGVGQRGVTTHLEQTMGKLVKDH